MAGDRPAPPSEQLEPWPDAYRSNVVIHHATLYPVVKTACGRLGPSSTEPQYVDCPACRQALGLEPGAIDDGKP